MYKMKLKMWLFWLGNIFLWGTMYWRLCVFAKGADYLFHENYTRLLLEGELLMMYPGYHIIVAVFTAVLSVDVPIASVIALTLAMCMSIYATKLVLRDILEIDFLTEIQLLLVAFLLNIVQPIFMYGYAPGYSSGNGYTSPTQTICKPVILWVIIVFSSLHKSDEINIKKQIQLMCALIISCLMKPMFAMAFVPAMGGLILWKEIKKCRRLSVKFISIYIKNVWPLIVTGVFMLIQYVYGASIEDKESLQLAFDANTNIRVGFLHAWRMVVDSVPISILMAYFFPFVIILLCCSYIRSNNSVKILDYIRKMHFYIEECIAYGLVSLIYIMFLYQDNGRETHMNFRNSWVVTFNMIYCMAMAVLIYMGKVKGQRSKGVRIGTVAFGIHIVFGVALIGKNFIM